MLDARETGRSRTSFRPIPVRRARGAGGAGYPGICQKHGTRSATGTGPVRSSRRAAMRCRPTQQPLQVALTTPVSGQIKQARGFQFLLRGRRALNGPGLWRTISTSCTGDGVGNRPDRRPHSGLRIASRGVRRRQNLASWKPASAAQEHRQTHYSGRLLGQQVRSPVHSRTSDSLPDVPGVRLNCALAELPGVRNPACAKDTSDDSLG